MARRSWCADTSGMAGFVILAMLVALGAASALGLTADSRDPRYGAGLIISIRRLAHTRSR